MPRKHMRLHIPLNIVTLPSELHVFCVQHALPQVVRAMAAPQLFGGGGGGELVVDICCLQVVAVKHLPIFLLWNFALLGQTLPLWHMLLHIPLYVVVEPSALHVLRAQHELPQLVFTRSTP